MKRIFFSLFAAVLLLCGCNKPEQFEVTLNLDNFDGQTVYLCKSVDGSDVVIDSAVIKEKKAVLYAPFGDPQTLYSIKFNKNAECGAFTFFSENQNTEINGVGDNMPRWKIKGCQTMNELSAHHEKGAKLYEDRILAIYVEMMNADSLKVEELNTQLQPIIKEYFDYQIEFIKSHSDSYIGHYMLDLIKNDIDFEIVKELSAGLSNESEFSRNVTKYIEKGPSNKPCCIQ